MCGLAAVIFQRARNRARLTARPIFVVAIFSLRLSVLVHRGTMLS